MASAADRFSKLQAMILHKLADCQPFSICTSSAGLGSLQAARVGAWAGSKHGLMKRADFLEHVLHTAALPSCQLGQEGDLSF